MMVKFFGIGLAVLVWSVLPPIAYAEDTEVTVHVIAKGAKFIGTSMGGARVVLRDTATGRVLASGVTAGSTGDTTRIMETRLGRNEPRSTPAEAQRAAGLPTARFVATLDIDEPIKVQAEVTGPLAKPQASVTVTSEQWLLPGRNVSANDGWLIELPGIVVDVLMPVVHSSATGTITVAASVMLMCGCPIRPGGTWDANDFEVMATVSRDGQAIESFPMSFAGTDSRFAGDYSPQVKGPQTITVTAWQRSNGNTGLDRTTVFAN